MKSGQWHFLWPARWLEEPKSPSMSAACHQSTQGWTWSLTEGVRLGGRWASFKGIIYWDGWHAIVRNHTTTRFPAPSTFHYCSILLESVHLTCCSHMHTTCFSRPMIQPASRNVAFYYVWCREASREGSRLGIKPFLFVTATLKTPEGMVIMSQAAWT